MKDLKDLLCWLEYSRELGYEEHWADLLRPLLAASMSPDDEAAAKAYVDSLDGLGLKEHERVEVYKAYLAGRRGRGESVAESGLTVNELALLYRLVLDHQVEAEKQGISQSEPSSVFRLSLIDKISAMKAARRPGDDGQAIDETWLHSLGFRELSGFAVGLVMVDEADHMRYRLRCCDTQNPAWCRWWLESLSDAGGEESTILPCRPRTRGDLRRLASALGVTLNESN